MAEILSFLTTHYPHLRLIVEPHTAREQSQFQNLTVFNEITDSAVKLLDNTDLVITLGGDGTVLHASQLFSRTECPPVLCFSLGSLGFLLPFKVQDIDRALHYILGDGEVEILNRMRLNALAVDSHGRTLSRMPESGWQVMNEVCLHRGRYPHLPTVDVYYNNQHLTEGLVSLQGTRCIADIRPMASCSPLPLDPPPTRYRPVVRRCTPRLTPSCSPRLLPGHCPSGHSSFPGEAA